ncbi:TIGR03084 family metal-binding protein [Amycolatopsis benzoatilytica]|uniref:TIGR03084 family metal-binding protein n=1 Tax=Amycolatopsis benzoatilytica TaxID=346045 RepID=UPI00038155F6|nr:TIGR03084 family metal-binding protein [Amycolatopsis benzoatilytica]
MAVSLDRLLDDLSAEAAEVEAMIGPLDDAGIARPTPAAGWTIRDQVTHLAFFDEAATRAAVDPDGFRQEASALMADGMDFPDRVAAQYTGLSAAETRAWFAQARAVFVTAFRGRDPRARLPWYGPDMSVASSVTARIMETWAHGQDIADALRVARPATDRLRHIAHLGVSTTGFSFRLNGRAAPAVPIRVELRAPSGPLWTWGAADAADRVEGTALDFCLTVTQRRHVDDTGLVVTGPVAHEWIGIAQAFAGAPGPGRERTHA